MFQAKDLAQLQSLGIPVSVVEQQVQHFKQGFPFLQIDRAATIGDGIKQVAPGEADALIGQYETAAASLKVLKFVPASGAASRMFKSLFSCLEKYDGSAQAKEAFHKDKGGDSPYVFFRDLNKFAFKEALAEALKAQGGDLSALIAAEQYGEVLAALLQEPGLNYGNLPKGLLLFHQYADGPRTALEEHLVEGANYAAGSGKKVYLHFTVSPEHEAKFKERVAATLKHYEQLFGVSFDIAYSQQKLSTDTVAVDMANEPFRNADGSLLFRPGGHGALLDNLNDMDADVIFIKNIDNVVPDHLKAETYRYKKIIAGVLLDYQTKIHGYLTKLEKSSDLDKAELAEIEYFIRRELCTMPPAGYEQKSDAERIAYCVRKLNRPIRVCGMVKNEGEPGGGPFWAQNADGTASLQVVESAQIDMGNAQQKQIAQEATHFNPVDIVCSTKDYKGRKFDLMQFRDPLTGFISKKSKDGRDLKALELPGLWNGSMSDWNTIFVEVPIITFNPVKTVNDLLRQEHQS